MWLAHVFKEFLMILLSNLLSCIDSMHRPQSLKSLSWLINLYEYTIQLFSFLVLKRLELLDLFGRYYQLFSHIHTVKEKKIFEDKLDI